MKDIAATEKISQLLILSSKKHPIPIKALSAF